MSDNILLAYGNKATGATLAGGTWDSTLALNNLKTGELAEVARSTNASVYNTQFRFDLAANYVLRALALVNHNLTTGALWRARTTDATLDMDFVGPTSMRPRTLTTSGGANGTRVNIYGQIEAATCPRYDFSPVNLASGTATQTISSVPAGTYLLITTGSNAAVMATGSTVSNTGTIGTTTYPAFVVVNATGNVTLTVLSAATAIHFRESLGLLVEEGRTNHFLNSATPATQTSGVLGTGSYTLSMSGSGSIAVAANSATITGAGTATDGSPVTFTVTVSGTVDYTVTGSPSRAQSEDGAFVTSHITTTGAAVTRTADNPRISGSNFSGFFNAAAGTLVTEFEAQDTTWYRGISSLNDSTYANCIQAYIDPSNAAVFGVETVGVTQTSLGVALGVGGKDAVAFAYAANDFAFSLNGASPSTDSSGALPSVSQLNIGAINGAVYPFNGHIRRIAYWPTRRTNAELQSITTTGPDALGLDTGWQPAKQMTFHGDTPTNWGEQYPLIATFDATTVRYGTVEIEDTANGDGYVELGQLFVAGGFQPEHNAEYQGFGDGRTDLSSSVKSVGGQKYSTARRRPRTVDFNFPILTQAEGDHLDEMMAEVGTTEDVLYVPDPADAAKSQRYGFLGTLRELTPLEYPFFDKRAMPLRLEQKL